mmetsp:Transcript_7460/g.19290  ORF Transcript_7460/g.19290 Transcript_7460/m.19290 type:complete len:502 (+) Transcript_7460:1681-3186(+)
MRLAFVHASSCTAPAPAPAPAPSACKSAFPDLNFSVTLGSCAFAVPKPHSRARPTWLLFSAPTSFPPSPHMRVVRPHTSLSAFTTSDFPSGGMRAKVLTRERCLLASGPYSSQESLYTSPVTQRLYPSLTSLGIAAGSYGMSSAPSCTSRPARLSAGRHTRHFGSVVGTPSLLTSNRLSCRASGGAAAIEMLSADASAFSFSFSLPLPLPLSLPFSADACTSCCFCNATVDFRQHLIMPTSLATTSAVSGASPVAIATRLSALRSSSTTAPESFLSKHAKLAKPSNSRLLSMTARSRSSPARGEDASFASSSVSRRCAMASTRWPRAARPRCTESYKVSLDLSSVPTASGDPLTSAQCSGACPLNCTLASTAMRCRLDEKWKRCSTWNVAAASLGTVRSILRSILRPSLIAFSFSAFSAALSASVFLGAGNPRRSAGTYLHPHPRSAAVSMGSPTRSPCTSTRLWQPHRASWKAVGASFMLAMASEPSPFFDGTAAPVACS